MMGFPTEPTSVVETDTTTNSRSRSCGGAAAVRYRAKSDSVGSERRGGRQQDRSHHADDLFFFADHIGVTAAASPIACRRRVYLESY